MKPTQEPLEDRSLISISGESFKPGQKGVVELPIGSLIDYQPVSMTVHIRRGKKEGPRLLLTAGIHGDEINGIEIVRRVLKSRLLSGLRGTLIAVPVVNTPAFLSRSRYLPDRRDLNRLFPGSNRGSLGGRLAAVFVNDILDIATHVIDMHTGSTGRANLPQIRITPSDEVAREMAVSFHAPVVIESSVRDGSFRATCAALSKPSILFEGGEAHRLDSNSVRYGFRGVISTMRALGMLPEEKRPARQKKRTIFSPGTSWVRAPRGGIFFRDHTIG